MLLSGRLASVWHAKRRVPRHRLVVENPPGGEEKTPFRWYIYCQVGEIVYHRSHLFWGPRNNPIDFFWEVKMVNSNVQFIFVEVNLLEMVDIFQPTDENSY